MTKNKYWKGIEEIENPKLKEQNDEFDETLPNLTNQNEQSLEKSSANRRDFLKMLGFSVTAATVAASCEMPVRKAVPYLVQPDDVTPGVANYYASTYADGGDYCSILVKTREGRPIKIEGNKLSPVTAGGTSAVVQASVLGLYDNYRPQAPKINGEKASWEQVDKEIIEKLKAIQAKGGQIKILSSTILSPSSLKVIDDFKGQYPNTEHVTYDAVSYSGLLDANEKAFGTRTIPGYDFSKAEVIVSFGADFLGTWLSPVEFANQYAKNRRVSKKKTKMSRHVQVESYLSLSGSNADKRIRIKPSEEGVALLHLYNVIASKTGGATTSNLPELDAQAKNDLARTAEELLKAKGKSLVVCGYNDTNAQLVAIGINTLLNNIGVTVNPGVSNQRQGNDKALNALVSNLNSVDALILWDANPAYNVINAEALKNVGLTISLNFKNDESTAVCQYTCPDNHYLESWNDASPKKGQYSLAQPTIAPLFDTRNAAESLLKWSGADVSYYDYIRNYWQENVFPQQAKYSSFDVMWDHALHDGVFETTVAEEAPASPTIDVAAAGSALAKKAGSSGIEVVLYEKTAIRGGKHGDNPWLQEMPDPVSKLTWDNYAAVSKKFAEDNGFNLALGRYTESVGKDAEVIIVKANGAEIKLPVIIQPGTPENTIAIALGYGKEAGGKAGSGIGQNAYPFIAFDGNNYQRSITGASIEVTGETTTIAATQHHHSINDGLNERRIVKETTLNEYKANPYAGNEDREKIKHHLVSLYPGHDDALKNGHHWELAIDLNTCIGCSACTIACTAENNVPVVGKTEVRRSREMHWLRIDRYYAGEESNPSVMFQPMMCQHCDNAPCENVCPVSATNHSSEGLNQMAYNRCFGTRYCANNCPYKVRRFNWFDYLGADSFSKGTIFDNDVDNNEMTHDLTRMVLNPDVTVRSRGVMEKCSFCVQRIQEGKLTAKKQGRGLQDDDIVTACQSACPTNAISFGDINNKDSEVFAWANDERGFKVLEEIDVLPSVTYLTKVRNKPENEA